MKARYRVITSAKYGFAQLCSILNPIGCIVTALPKTTDVIIDGQDAKLIIDTCSAYGVIVQIKQSVSG